MAISPSHRLGQIIGDVLESAVTPLLNEFSKKHGLYLDKKGSRPCRSGQKCTWVDLNKNAHDLDFVLERGGSLRLRGAPVAFIETAWRRYTKHSRNKAQEIQGAILPLAETYSNFKPFKGVILAGVFTKGALKQLESLDFSVLFFPLETVVAVFRRFGIDIFYDEDTPDSACSDKATKYLRLSDHAKSRLAEELIQARRAEVKKFIKTLEETILRRVESITILPLYGSIRELKTVEEAICFLTELNPDNTHSKFIRYEVRVRYTNGNVIEGRFQDKPSAIEFLKSYEHQ